MIRSSTSVWPFNIAHLRTHVHPYPLSICMGVDSHGDCDGHSADASSIRCMHDALVPPRSPLPPLDGSRRVWRNRPTEILVKRVQADFHEAQMEVFVG